MDIAIKPHRKTLQQTAVILNVSVRTVRRYLDCGKLTWSGNQVSIDSIILFLQTATPKDKEKTFEAHPAPQRRRVISRGQGWVKRW